VGRGSIIFIFIFFSGVNCCLAQTGKIDSLRKICYSDKPVTERVETFLLLLRENDSMPYEEWIKILNDAEVLVNQVNTPSAKCGFVRFKSRYFRITGKTDSSNFILASTLEKYKNNQSVKDQLLFLEFRLATVPVDEGRYKEGIEAMLTLLKKVEEQKDTRVWGYVCNSIGFSYMDMGRYDEAIPWFKKVVEFKFPPNEPFEIAKETNNLASCLNNVKQYNAALLYIDKGIERAKAEQNLKALANGYSIKADIVINIGQKEKAEALLMQAIEIRKKIGNADFVASDMAQISIYFASVGKYDKGIATAQEALKIFEDNKLVAKTMFAYEALRTNYKNKGDDKNHALVLEKMLALKDSLYTTNSAEALTELQQKFEVEKKERTIAQQQLDLVKRKILLYTAAAGILLILSILGYRFKKYQLKQKIIAAQKRKESDLAVKDAEEKERKRIAAELHDNLGVQANAILHNSTLLMQENTNNKNVVADLQETAKEMLLNLRETLWAMRATDVAAADLWLRIISFMKQMGRHYTSLQFVIEGEAPADIILPSNKALNMVLVLQETVNNAVKHAEATTIITKSRFKDNEWEISIEDDGKGFDINTAKQKNESYGLTNMQERAVAGNFRYTIETAPGNGVTAIISASI
jgi:two-component system, NarL family, sensor kinase